MKVKRFHRWNNHVTMTKKERNLLIWKCHVTMTKKGKKLLMWNCHVTMTRKRENLLIWKSHVTMTGLEAYKKQQFLAPKSFSIFHCQKLFTSFGYQCAIYLNHGFKHYCLLEKLICTDYVDFGTGEFRFGCFSWSKKDSNYLVVKPKEFKGDDNRDFGLVQNLTMGEGYFKRFIRLRNQMVNAAENLSREENLSPMLIPTMSKDMNEKLKLANKLIDVVDRTNRKVYVTLLWYNVEKPESSFAQSD